MTEKKEPKIEQFLYRIDLYRLNLPQYKEIYLKILAYLTLKLNVLIDDEKEKLINYCDNDKKNLTTSIEKLIRSYNKSENLHHKENMFFELNDTVKLLELINRGRGIKGSEVKEIKNYCTKYKKNLRLSAFIREAQILNSITQGTQHELQPSKFGLFSYFFPNKTSFNLNQNLGIILEHSCSYLK